MTTSKKSPTKGKKGAGKPQPPPTPTRNEIAPAGQPGKVKGKSPAEIQKILMQWMRMYGETVTHWDYFPNLLRQIGLERKDVTEEICLLAKQTLADIDYNWRCGLKEHNKTSRLQVIVKGDPELDPAQRPSPSTPSEESSEDLQPRQPRHRSKMSALDAAAKVLEEENRHMTAKELIALMESKGYWKSPGGLTPDATLGAAIYSDIKKNPHGSRFVRPGRGLFALAHQ